MEDKIKNNPEATIIADELDKFSAIEAVLLSKGGEILFKSLMEDVVSKIDTLIANYQSLTREDFIGISAEIKTKLDLARVMKKSTKNKDQARKDLEEVLLEN